MSKTNFKCKVCAATLPFHLASCHYIIKEIKKLENQIQFKQKDLAKVKKASAPVESLDCDQENQEEFDKWLNSTEEEEENSPEEEQKEEENLKRPGEDLKREEDRSKKAKLETVHILSKKTDGQRKH